MARPGQKAELHVLKAVARRDHQHGDSAAAVAQAAHQRIAVQLRHHDVRDDEVDIVALEDLQRLHTVGCADGLEAVARHGLTPVGTAGEAFTPELHEAVGFDAEAAPFFLEILCSTSGTCLIDISQ